jgi:phosphoglycolate phosphatase
VVNRFGELTKAFAFGGMDVQAELLRAEGVEVVGGRVELEKYFSPIEEISMKYKAVIFDLDGTLLDTIEDLAGGVNYAMRCFNFPEYSVEEVRSFVGNGVRNLILRALPESKKDMIDTVLPVFKEYYGAHSKDKTAPYEGIIELLVALKQKGVKTAILSNKFDGAVKALAEEYFPGLIDYALGEGNGVKVKPDPEGMNHVFEVLGVKKEESLYIGDSEVDVVTAIGVGVDLVAVSWGFRDKEVLLEHGATVVADSVRELHDMLV